MAARAGIQRYLVVLRRIQSLQSFTTVIQVQQTLKASRFWRSCMNQCTKFRLGTFFTTSLAMSRGLGFWSGKPKETEPEVKPSQVSPEVLAAEEADRLYTANQVVDFYNHMMRFKDTNNDELLWRLARACRCVAQLSTTQPEEKKRLTYEALEYAKRGLERNDKNFACHKWYAICISEVGDYEGTKQKISNAYLIRDHFLKAIELNPNDATSVHLMGLWCFTFADMPWYQKKIAAVVFSTPPSSTYQEALEKFRKAEEMSPNFYSKNLLMLGKTYQRMGDVKMAMLYLTKAKDYPPKKEEDVQVNKEAKEMLDSLK